MALSPQLLQFKSSGVYRLEFDKSQTSNIPADRIRLVVGHSRKGPYNTPTLISTTEQFIAVFGSIDKNLEKKGMFFHRSALAALTRGPILALNAATLDSNDLISYAAPVSNGTVSTSELTGDSAYYNYFNTEKFWSPSDEALNDVVGDSANNILRFANIKQDNVTVIVRKAKEVTSFDILARDWYGEGNVPSYLNAFDYMSDFMVDVFVFKGDFNASAMSTDPVYGEYFTTAGLRIDKLDEFVNLRQVSLLAKYTGSLLPGFVDKEGNALYIETTINSEARRTGLFCAVNEDAVIDETGTKVDLVGHINGAGVSYDAMSYSLGADARAITLDPALVYAKTSGAFVTYTASPTTTTTYTPNANALTTGSNTTNAITPALPSTPSITSSTTGSPGTAGTRDQLTMPGTGTSSNSTAISWANARGIYVGDYLLNVGGGYSEILSITWFSGSGGSVIITIDHPLTGAANDVAAAYVSTSISTYTIVPAATATVATDTITFTGFDPVAAGITTADFILDAAGTGYVAVTTVTTTTIESAANVNAAAYTITAGGNINTYTSSVVSAPAPNLALEAGQYIIAEEPNRMVKVIRIAKSTVGSDIVYKVYTSGEANDTADMKGYKSFETSTDYYVTFPINGAVIIDKPNPIQSALDAVTLGTGLATALIDKDNISFRYVVDTFASLDGTTLLNKVQLSALAKARQNASAILNAPSVAEFKKSTDPSFTDSFGTFKIEYVATGGNLDKNPVALYALPSINDGANYAFFFTSLIVRENNKDFVMPSAAYVSNNFIDKYTDSSPWAIVAGPRRGAISGSGIVGAEYAFDRADRDVLEPFGINPIVFQRGAGLTILGNKTAQQSVQSALSSAHVREVLIYIQDGLAAILKDYVFEFNTPQTRLEIKTLADSFMESVKAETGVYDFKNVIDTTNNTNEVIDANIGILDTFVEPVKGLEIVVQRTTVLNTGEIASGSFN